MSNNRRIVFASEFWFGATTDGLAHGLRKEGWDICYVDTNHHFLQGRSLELRLVSRALERLSISSYNAAVLDAVERLKPRAFLTAKGVFLTPDTLKQIRRFGAMTVNYYPDYHFDFRQLDQATLPLYDRFITTKSFQLPFLCERLTAERVEFLHHGYSSLVHFPRLEQVAETDYVADCAYTGNYSPYKARWLEAVVRKLPALRLVIVGNGWSERTKNTPVEGNVYGCHLVGDAYSRFLQTVRINLAFHMGPFGSNGWQDLVSTRTFEIPACKGFMLHIDNDEVRDLFEPGKEIDVFGSEEELCEKIAHYLAYPKLRSDMIERAYARAVPAYSYDARAKRMIELIGIG
jgi:spore maturation protein CgeB